MYVIELRKNGEWTAWTSTANPSRLPGLMGLAKVLHPRTEVRVRP